MNARAVLAVLAAGAVLVNAVAGERLKRPMQVNRVAEVGLEIWTERNPPWAGRVEQVQGKPVYVVTAPENNHPPAVLTYLSLPEAGVIPPSELAEVARGAIHQAARNYGARNPTAVSIRAASHGKLQGYEAVFPGRVEALDVDVRIFVGAAPGRPLVAMHAYTPRGKMAHISENLRRAWTHVEYLPRR